MLCREAVTDLLFWRVASFVQPRILEIAPAGEYSPTVFHLHAEMGLYLVTSIAPICFCCLFIAGSVGRKVRYLCPNNTPWRSEHRLPPGTSSRGITQQNRGGHRSPRNSYLRNKRPLYVLPGSTLFSRFSEPANHNLGLRCCVTFLLCVELIH